MARQVLTKAVTIPAAGYGQPARTLPAGTVVELSAAEITAITSAGGAVRVTAARDGLGEGAGASNSN
jgi:hypothetical protein